MLLSCQINDLCKCDTEWVLLAQGRLSVVSQELGGGYSYKGEVFVAVELTEEYEGFGLVFVSFQWTLLG